MRLSPHAPLPAGQNISVLEACDDLKVQLVQAELVFYVWVYSTVTQVLTKS